jgi:hypothetical protein
MAATGGDPQLTLPGTDFCHNQRPDAGTSMDVGAAEIQVAAALAPR